MTYSPCQATQSTGALHPQVAFNPQKQKITICDLPVEILEKIDKYVADVAVQLFSKEIYKKMRENVKKAAFIERRPFFHHSDWPTEHLKPSRFPNLQAISIKLDFWPEESSQIQNFPHYPSLQTLAIANRFFLNSEMVLSLSRNVQLQHLHLGSCEGIQPSCLQNLMQSNFQLQSLTLQGASFEGMSDTPFPHLSNLTRLELDHIRNAADQILGNLLESMTRLKKLSILYCRQSNGSFLSRLKSDQLESVTLNGLDSIIIEDFFRFVKKCPLLTFLDLEGPDNRKLFAPKDHNCKFDQFIHLKELSLRYIDFKEMSSFLKFGASIENLSLSECSNTGEIEKIFAEMPSLKQLFLEGKDWKDSHVQYITHKAEKLMKIEVHECPNLTGEAWNLADFAALRRFSFTHEGSEYFYNYSDLGDLLRRSPELVEISFNGAAYDNNDLGCLKEISKKLKVLDLCYVELDNDLSLLQILECNHNIEIIKLQEVSGLTDKFMTLLMQCKQLKGGFLEDLEPSENLSNEKLYEAKAYISGKYRGQNPFIS